MNTLKEKRFKGEIERYLNQNHNLFESRVKDVFSLLNIKTWLHRTGIFKKEGYHAAHLLFVLVVLPVLKLKTVHSFCNKFWYHWSQSQKDTFYRFKRNTSYRWRAFLLKINLQVFENLEIDKIPVQERYFILDDTVFRKRGKQLENISFVRDHSLEKSVLGYCTVVLTLFTDKGVYPLDFAYRFGKTRHPKSQPEMIKSPKSSFGQRSYEAKYKTKLESGKDMIARALKNGITPGYVLFDSWYSHPSFIKSILDLDEQIHVVCRLKSSKTRYWYQNKPYTLNELYKKVQSSLKKDAKIGLPVKRVSVTLPGFGTDEMIRNCFY